ncbi:MAG: VWA domain-containing protein [Phycisphaerales bacterium]|nr:VWA domain-containing protein [Phycisphaerales bacterium]
MNAEFAYPWVFWFATAIPFIWIVELINDRRRHGVASSVPTRLAAAGSSLRIRLRWISPLLLSAGLLAGLFALARPRETITDSKSQQDAIAIQLVVDRSGSMKKAAMFEGTTTTRLEAVKKVVEEFVLGDGDQLKGRPGDLLGLIVFGTYADTMMPLTQSHDVLVDAIRRVELPRQQSEQSTAIGDALVLACARLKASEDSMKLDLDDQDFEIKSKAIILLTDGENQAGDYSPDQAARLAADWGITIYIIGIRGQTKNPFGFGMRMGQEVNENRMAAVAEHTGGGFWAVESLDDLAGVYATIDELERTEVQISETTRYKELYHPFAVACLGLLGFGYLWRLGAGGEIA